MQQLVAACVFRLRGAKLNRRQDRQRRKQGGQASHRARAGPHFCAWPDFRVLERATDVDARRQRSHGEMLRVRFQRQVDGFLRQIDVATDIGDALPGIERHRFEFEDAAPHSEIANKALHLRFIWNTQCG